MILLRKNSLCLAQKRSEFDGSITPTASQTVGDVRAPDRAINGSGIFTKAPIGDVNQTVPDVIDAGLEDDQRKMLRVTVAGTLPIE